MESLHELLDDSGQIYEDLRAEGQRLCTPTSSAPDVMLWPFEGQSGLFRIVTRKDLGTHLNVSYLCVSGYRHRLQPSNFSVDE